MAIVDRVKKAWNAFLNSEDEAFPVEYGGGVSYSGASPSRPRLRYYNDRSISTAIYTRISIDVAGVSFRHIQVDEFDRYLADKDSQLNSCLTLEANIDQAPRAFRQDVAMELCDKGYIAIVPVDSTLDPITNQLIDVYSLRVGHIVKWHPRHVRVSIWNEQKQARQEVTLEKRFVAIVENPFYSVMNEPNSTLQRLTRKLSLLDAIDEQSASGKLDIIIQLPYTVKSEARKQQAEERREAVEFQLKGSKYGIAYIDGTEKITQLNRPAENNLMGQVEFLVKELYGELGLTEEIMNGTADEKTMLNYINRTVEPFLDAIMEAMQRTFVGPHGIMKKEKIAYFRDPFKLVPVTEIAEIADKFSRNEILTPNEIRGIIGFRPDPEPKSDKLANSNMPQSNDGSVANV